MPDLDESSGIDRVLVVTDNDRGLSGGSHLFSLTYYTVNKWFKHSKSVSETLEIPIVGDFDFR